MGLQKTAKRNSMKYYTSDNCIYINPDLEALKKHCISSGVKLYDENKNEIELKPKKTK